MSRILILTILSTYLSDTALAFSASAQEPSLKTWLQSPEDAEAPAIETVADASLLLGEWDRFFNPEAAGGKGDNEVASKLKDYIPTAVRILSETAAEERAKDSAQGRCMLGICASSMQDGIEALKSFVTTLELPRGLLHGADKDGVPLEIKNGVYIKYNSGGVYSFADIRKSGLGFDALWKPGDAMLEQYDGDYRGVYFQVELSDGEFRQYLVPLDTF
ncbi:unnamed protein product [Cylindrotheca closterium]|uniref:Plastid lipid-associated protein/fibrillin conserved domain-containing protein n=1 Tax=Cylindrotheca closterium TaxID=2856 RepID=A0AAD2FVT0_9STRA|nr:unnamed protein product [Cylindrotheca closterium]